MNLVRFFLYGFTVSAIVNMVQLLVIGLTFAWTPAATFLKAKMGKKVLLDLHTRSKLKYILPLGARNQMVRDKKHGAFHIDPESIHYIKGIPMVAAYETEGVTIDPKILLKPPKDLINRIIKQSKEEHVAALMKEGMTETEAREKAKGITEQHAIELIKWNQAENAYKRATHPQMQQAEIEREVLDVTSKFNKNNMLFALYAVAIIGAVVLIIFAVQKYFTDAVDIKTCKDLCVTAAQAVKGAG